MGGNANNIERNNNPNSAAMPATPRMLGQNSGIPSNTRSQHNTPQVIVTPNNNNILNTPATTITSNTKNTNSGLMPPISLPPQQQQDTPISNSTSKSNTMATPPRVVRKQPKEFHRTSLGDWDFVENIGSGSMGKVKVARHRYTNEVCAIKIVTRAAKTFLYKQEKLPPPVTKEEKQEFEKKLQKEISRDKRTIREASLGQILYHPHICRLFEMCTMTTHFYMLFEYVKGGQLLDYIIQHGSLKEKHARKFARGIASALEYLHMNNIVHRDLKIENIMISQSGEIKLIDFGLSNFYNKKEKLHTFCGSLYFAAPELLMAHPYTGPEVDVWSFGVVLYVLVCGKVPFDDENANVLHQKIKEGKVEYPNHLSIEVIALLSKMLVVDPSRRASLKQVVNHQWMNKNYDFIVPCYLPHRLPLSHINPVVVKEMGRLELVEDVPDAIRTLENLIYSQEYMELSRQFWMINRENVNSDFSGVLGSGKNENTFQSNNNSDVSIESQRSTTVNTVNFIENDPSRAYHPLISIYYLVDEMMKRKQAKLRRKAAILKQQQLESPRQPIITSSSFLPQHSPHLVTNTNTTNTVPPIVTGTVVSKPTILLPPNLPAPEQAHASTIPSPTNIRKSSDIRYVSGSSNNAEDRNNDTIVNDKDTGVASGSTVNVMDIDDNNSNNNNNNNTKTGTAKASIATNNHFNSNNINTVMSSSRQQSPILPPTLQTTDLEAQINNNNNINNGVDVLLSPQEYAGVTQESNNNNGAEKSKFGSLFRRFSQKRYQQQQQQQQQSSNAATSATSATNSQPLPSVDANSSTDYQPMRWRRSHQRTVSEYVPPSRIHSYGSSSVTSRPVVETSVKNEPNTVNTNNDGNLAIDQETNENGGNLPALPPNADLMVKQQELKERFNKMISNNGSTNHTYENGADTNTLKPLMLPKNTAATDQSPPMSRKMHPSARAKSVGHVRRESLNFVRPPVPAASLYGGNTINNRIVDIAVNNNNGSDNTGSSDTVKTSSADANKYNGGSGAFSSLSTYTNNANTLSNSTTTAANNNNNNNNTGYYADDGYLQTNGQKKVEFDNDKYDLNEELTDSQILQQASQAPPGSMPSIDYPRSLFLKGFFSVQTTSSKPLPIVRHKIITTLNKLNIKFKEVKGGFICVHEQSIQPLNGTGNDTNVGSFMTVSPEERKPSIITIDDNNSGGSANSSFIEKYTATNNADNSSGAAKRSTSVNYHNSNNNNSSNGRTLATIPTTPKASSSKPFNNNYYLSPLPQPHTTLRTNTQHVPDELSTASLDADEQAQLQNMDDLLTTSRAHIINNKEGVSEEQGDQQQKTEGEYDNNKVPIKRDASNGIFSNNSNTASEEFGKQPLKFEIHIVKVRIIGLAGIHFKKVSGNTWMYKKLATHILKELNL
ncbi:serine/threonine protein kinase KIN2 SCDLUD_001717 [Saccharomycodes ludwigii]|nr:hypothetical protein SCDLUD_001717 [Saccharomycodes ludwigii]KAH3901932.1 hypothetical protein SCDLUD_001717 [Saccharomycodes ludwigii]